MTNASALEWKKELLKLKSKKILLGFDAFIDQKIEVVDKRHSTDSYQVFPTIGDLGQWIQSRSGRSGLKELIYHESEAGGCSVNLADALSELCEDVSVYANFSKERDIDPVFAELAGKVKLHNTGMNPGLTQAWEFQDGKLMFVHTDHLADFNLDLIKTNLPKWPYKTECEIAEAIVLTNWALYPHMTSVWEYLNETVWSKASKQNFIFIDLAEISSRKTEEILAMANFLQTIKKPLVLSLNGNEAKTLLSAFDIEMAVNAEDFLEAAVLLREKLNIAEVGIHLRDRCCLANETESISLEGPLCEKPKKSTGAGDRFNAGYLSGKLLSLSSEKTLRLASALSGSFVRLGRSPDIEELAQMCLY